MRTYIIRSVAVAVLVMLNSNVLAQTKIVAYVPNWVDLATFVDSIDYAKLTHINIAFENPVDDAGTLSFSSKNDVLIARAHEKRVKVLVSIGGGAASSNKPLVARYFDLQTDAKRAGFVAKLVDYVTEHNFDGLDVDIEGPSIGKDYGAFIQDLSKALKAKDKLITAALSKGYGGDHVPDSVFKAFDFVNIMAYDGTGPWDPKSAGPHSSIEFAKDNVKYWLDRGLPKSKAVLGVPFYGYGSGESFRKRDYPYNTLLDQYPEAAAQDEVGKTIWHNSLPTMRAKAKYVVDEGLAGMMIWSLDYDVKGKNSLLSAMFETLQTSAKKP
jgi:chitinase